MAIFANMILRPLALLLFSYAVCDGPKPAHKVRRVPFDLDRPTKVIHLPRALTEISALTDADDDAVACVQDEAATVYIVSLTKGIVVDSFAFGGAADMEGLTRVNRDYFALRSDGSITRIGPPAEAARRWAVKDSFRLNVPNRNIEGLGYDARRDLVLISPKDFIKGSKEGRDERVLYAFSPEDPSHEVREVLRLSVQELIGQANAEGVEVPERETKKGRVVPALKLRYSSVAVHPVTDHYYLLSAVDRTLLVVDREGRLVALEQLDEDLLPKPEGITFMTNGDLVLSSEGKDSEPVIVRYGYLGS